MQTSIVVTGACGRMGKAITEMVREDSQCLLAGLLERSELLAQAAPAQCPVSSSAAELLPSVKGAVIIDFTAPDASLALARVAAENGNPLVIGTTGLSETQKVELAELARQVPIFWSPNMSIGVNVLLKVLPELTRLLGEQYDVEMVELHHNRKKDSPSGTALRLAECLAEAKDWNLPDVACYHREGIIGERPVKEIGVQTIRGGDVVGVHTVYFMGPGERIEVTHQAHSRENFARGALRAAKWLAQKDAGTLYSMQDIF